MGSLDFLWNYFRLRGYAWFTVQGKNNFWWSYIFRTYFQKLYILVRNYVVNKQEHMMQTIFQFPSVVWYVIVSGIIEQIQKYWNKAEMNTSSFNPHPSRDQHPFKVQWKQAASRISHRIDVEMQQLFCKIDGEFLSSHFCPFSNVFCWEMQFRKENIKNSVLSPVSTIKKSNKRIGYTNSFVQHGLR